MTAFLGHSDTSARRSRSRLRAAFTGGVSLLAATALALPALAQNDPPAATPTTPAAPVTPAPVSPSPAAPAATPAAPAATPAAPAAGSAEQKPAAPKPVAKKKPAPAPTSVTALSTDPQPSYGPATVANTQVALQRYRSIAAQGGWPTVHGTLSKGAKGAAVATLRKRLAAEGDLADASGEVFDEAVVSAVKKFQRRVGLAPSGLVGAATVKALNVPVSQRVIAIEKTLERLSDSRFGFGDRYVVVNIPATAVEAIDQGQVSRRHVVIVGKPERASPMVETRLTVVNFNPTWTIPTSLIKKDIIPKMRKNPNTLSAMHVRMLDGRGNEVDPRSIDWSTERAVNYTLRQDPGTGNSLGRVRIDMPNREAVFMHDTPSRKLFLSDARFFSSGCVRIGDVENFVSWLLAPQGWDKPQTVQMMSQPERKDVRLSRPVPVSWVYMTGWASPDGTVHFRDDIYGYDAPGVPQPRVVRAGERPAVAQGMGGMGAGMAGEATGIPPAAVPAPAAPAETNWLKRLGTPPAATPAQ